LIQYPWRYCAQGDVALRGQIRRFGKPHPCCHSHVERWLGVGFALLYRRGLPRSRIVAATAVAVTPIEHCSQNAIVTGGASKIVAELLLAITLSGRLSAIKLRDWPRRK
jgi:hypothetical protein